MLRGGRNFLLESAQEATLMSVATLSLPRQSYNLPVGGGKPISPVRDCFHLWASIALRGFSADSAGVPFRYHSSAREGQTFMFHS
jgi:hypothetical protein